VAESLQKHDADEAKKNASLGDVLTNSAEVTRVGTQGIWINQF